METLGTLYEHLITLMTGFGSCRPPLCQSLHRQKRGGIRLLISVHTIYSEVEFR